MKTIQLSEFLHSNNNTLSITVPAEQHFVVTDDLTSKNVFDAKIEFILEKESILDFTSKELDGIEVIKHDDNVVVTSNNTSIIEREIIVRLQGEDAQANINCSYFGIGDKTYKVKTLQDHQAPRAKSNVMVKSVLTDKSKLFCSSMIHVQKDAQQTDAEQNNKNILLSDHARATSIPQLEVLANDVSCKHGAAVSKIDKEHLFYLLSRGIDAKQTNQMLIEAFLQ